MLLLLALVTGASASLVISEIADKDGVGGACEVRVLDGQGHRGCPADAARNFLTEAAGEAAEWLAAR